MPLSGLQRRLARISTRNLIALILFVVTVLPLIGVASWQLRTDLRASTLERDQRLSLVGRDAWQTLRSQIDFAVESTRAAANTPGLVELLGQRPDPDMATRHLVAFASRDPLNIRSTALLDPEGRVVASTRSDEVGTSEAKLEWFQSVRRRDLLQMLGPYLLPGHGEPTLVVAAAVQAKEEQAFGTLRLLYDPTLIHQTLNSTLRNRPGLGAVILDTHGAVVASAGPPLDPALAARAIRTSPQDIQDAEGRVAARALTVLVPRTSWRLILYEPQSIREQATRQYQQRWLGNLLLLGLLLLGAALLIGSLIARPVVRLTRTFDAIAGGDLERRAEPSGTREFQRLASAVNAMSTRLAENLASLSAELQQRAEAERSLRLSEERLSRLIEQIPGTVYRCRLDADWTMEYVSQQIEQLTGYPAEALLGNQQRSYGSLIHPEDLDKVDRDVRAAVDKRRPFDLRYRLIRRDGSVRWIWERGQADFDERGEPRWLDGVLLDISDQQWAERAMRVLQDSTEGRTGGDYFSTLPQALCRALQVRLALLLRRESDGSLAVLSASLDGTPDSPPLDASVLRACERANGGPALAVASGFGGQFGPIDREQTLAIESVAALPLTDRNGTALGVLAVFDDVPLGDVQATLDLLGVCAARAVAEIERNQAQLALHVLAAELEHRVEQRTADLEASNQKLSVAMQQIVQTEKLASLGSLVAGVAHELNTPIGNALTAATSLQASLRTFDREVEGGQLRRSTLTHFVAEGKEAGVLIERNLHRAAELISHFKQVAVDQTSARRRKFDLRLTTEEVLSTLLPRLKRLPHRVEIDIDEGLLMDSFPGALEQVVTNLISNSLDHAFAEGQAGRIEIEAHRSDHSIQLRYSDDGVGIPKSLQRRVFDPFYTTRLGSGGSGLGLYLVYSLVTGPLGGQLELRSESGMGTTFLLQLPLIAPSSPSEHSA